MRKSEDFRFNEWQFVFSLMCIKLPIGSVGPAKLFCRQVSSDAMRCSFSCPVIFAIFILLSIVNPARTLAQGNGSSLSTLLDKSLEELMTIQIDSVYGASGFNQI